LHDKKVVSFTIAVNDYYKPKDAERGVKTTTYFDCSYWVNPAIAKYLLQGTLVEVEGRIYVTAYTGKDGKARAVSIVM
jgi:single-strand DNA-binding protein